MSAGAFDISNFTVPELALLKYQCEQDFDTFCHVLFRATTGRKWIPAPFHPIVVDTLTKITNGKILQLIVNIPPRYGKTWAIVVLWVAWNLARSPWSRFFYTSYSDDLVLKSSRYVKDVISCELFQLFWGYKFRKDETAKKSWELAGHGGGLNAASVGGQITGFGAGVTGYEDVFSGARVVDDANKVQDSGSRLASKNVHTFFDETFESRKEHRLVPTLIVQQRTCEDDLTAHLLIDGPEGYWHHLLIPALISETDEYPKEYKYGIQIPHGLPPGALWDYKHTVEELEAMRDNKATEYKFWSQYQQVPRVRGGGMVKGDWLVNYREYDPKNATVDGVRIQSKRIYADTAQEAKEHNDRSVFLVAGYLADGRVAVLDLWYGRVEAPELIEAAKNIVYKHVFRANHVNVGLSALKVEKKASGHGLIQTLKKDRDFKRLSHNIPVVGIERNRDKVSRMHGVTPHIAAGCLLIPELAPWRSELVSELTSFTELGTAAHDDITDTVMDAVEDFKISGGSIDYGAVYG